MEIESALVANPLVAEAAVVGKPHDIKGEAVFAFVVCRGQRPTGDTNELVQKLRAWVGEQVGAIAKPDDIRFADNLPKTRSGKIMRRLLRSIARGEEILQDVSTLENPAILDQLRGADAGGVPGPAVAAPDAKTTVKRPAKKSAKKSAKASRRAAARRAPVKASAKRSATRAAAKKTAAKKTTTKKTAVKKTAARKTGAKKSPGRKVAARKVSRRR
jgi:hypothetical protein